MLTALICFCLCNGCFGWFVYWWLISVCVIYLLILLWYLLLGLVWFDYLFVVFDFCLIWVGLVATLLILGLCYKVCVCFLTIVCVGGCLFMFEFLFVVWFSTVWVVIVLFCVCLWLLWWISLLGFVFASLALLWFIFVYCYYYRLLFAVCFGSCLF